MKHCFYRALMYFILKETNIKVLKLAASYLHSKSIYIYIYIEIMYILGIILIGEGDLTQGTASFSR